MSSRCVPSPRRAHYSSKEYMLEFFITFQPKSGARYIPPPASTTTCLNTFRQSKTVTSPLVCPQTNFTIIPEETQMNGNLTGNMCVNKLPSFCYFLSVSDWYCSELGILPSLHYFILDLSKWCIRVIIPKARNGKFVCWVRTLWEKRTSSLY